MKINILIFFCLGSLYINAQETNSKNSLGYGIGYFGDLIQYLNPGFGDKPVAIKDNPKVLGKIYHGYAMKCSYERELNTGFIFSSTVYMAKVNSYYNDPLEIYWDVKSSDYYFIYEFSFAKDVIRKGKHSLLPNAGLFYRHLIMSNVDYTFEVRDNSYYLSQPDISPSVMNDLGFCVGIDYRRIFNKHFFIGLSVHSNFVFSIGLETINISPVLGVQL